MRNNGRTKSIARLVSLACIASGLGFAQTWSGALVDAGCFRAAQQNHNEDVSLGAQDVGLQLRLCKPGRKTHLFAVVERDGTMIRLAPSVNADAAKLAQQGPKQDLWLVTVNGSMQDHTVTANSIVAEK